MAHQITGPAPLVMFDQIYHKVTVESLLERTPRVWNVYGGVNRVAASIIDILKHGLRICDEKGEPDLSRFIEELGSVAKSANWNPPCDNSIHYPEHIRGNKGLLWVYWHVENLSIGEKLAWLMTDKRHLNSCYFEDAFVCDVRYCDAMLTCVKALEQDLLYLIADIEPCLYVLPSGPARFRRSHRRCVSMPQQPKPPLEMELIAAFKDGINWRVVNHEREDRHAFCNLGGTPVFCGNIPNIGSIGNLFNYTSTLPQRKSKSLPLLVFETPYVRSNNSLRRYEQRLALAAEATATKVGTTAGQAGRSSSSSGEGISHVHPDLDRRLLRAGRAPLHAIKPSSSWAENSDKTPTPPSSGSPTADSTESEPDVDNTDAEQLAFTILSQFDDYKLPRASELKWLVGADDTPQEMLPLPGVAAAAAVIGHRTSHRMPEAGPSKPGGWPKERAGLRGTADWAPPRPQVIFTIHPSPKRKVIMLRQNMRCAGCGYRVAAEYAHRYRYCDYLGRYFCTACHSNQLSIIPARVIHNWDFTKYSVSNFSHMLIEKMMSDPLFRIDDLNPKLYRKVKPLDRTRSYRLQLQYLKDFLITCRFANHLREQLTQIAPYSLTEPDKFSLTDLSRVRSGELPAELTALVKTGVSHVDTCSLCQARGFLCESCPCRNPIFPWSLGEVSRCRKCGACYHAKCFKRVSQQCHRCIRIAARNAAKSDS